MVSDVTFRKPDKIKPNSKVKAEVSFILKESVLLSARLIQGPKGLFLGFPSEKRDGEYRPTVDIVNREMRYEVQRQVLEAWEAFCKGPK